MKSTANELRQILKDHGVWSAGPPGSIADLNARALENAIMCWAEMRRPTTGKRDARARLIRVVLRWRSAGYPGLNHHDPWPQAVIDIRAACRALDAAEKGERK